MYEGGGLFGEELTRTVIYFRQQSAYCVYANEGGGGSRVDET